MRDAVSRLEGDPEKINPVCPADLVIDHSIQVDVSRRYHIFSYKTSYYPSKTIPKNPDPSCKMDLDFWD